MLWEVIVPSDDDGQLGSSITVEADNWFSALRSGLTKHGLDGQLVSNLTCDIKPDRSVHVTDFVTRKVYTLRPVVDGAVRKSSPPAQAAATAKSPAPAAAKPAPAPTSDAGVIPDLPPDLPRHEVFYWQDEAPPDGSGIFYRERLVAVAADTPEEEAGRLAMAIFDRLKAMGSEPGTKLFIDVQVFDHRFADRSQRPAIAAATWKEWSPKKTKVQFPLSGAEAVTFSQVPPPPEPAAPEPAEPAPQAEEATPEPGEEPVDLVQPEPEPEVPPKPPAKVDEPPAPMAPTVQTSSPAAPPVMPFTPLVPTDDAPAEEQPPEPEVQPIDFAPPPAAAAEPEPKPEPAPPRAPTPLPPRAPTPLPPSPSLTRGSDVEDKIVEAFERMQELFTLRDHDEVANFALKVSREFIYAADAAEGILLATEHYNGSEPVNIGAGFEISIKDLAEKIATLMGFQGAIRWDRSQPDGQPRRCLDVSRARDWFDFEAKMVLDDGLRKTIDWYRTHQAGGRRA